MNSKNTLELPKHFKNPFKEENPDNVWKRIQGKSTPLSREQEEKLRKGELTIEQIKESDNK